ncbi:MAG: peptidoglycan-associated lipoprotein, partial [Clostridia bacterium]|nr:peptidoglycan-associated lipoprotein [Clostridia bacterium]
MNCMAKMQAFLLCAALFFTLFSPGRKAESAAAEGGAWATAAEAEAARAAAEEKARGQAQE